MKNFTLLKALKCHEHVMHLSNLVYFFVFVDYMHAYIHTYIHIHITRTHTYIASHVVWMRNFSLLKAIKCHEHAMSNG